jgi:hypothetical protein
MPPVGCRTFLTFLDQRASSITALAAVVVR